jgi:hypothetical protein
LAISYLRHIDDAVLPLRQKSSWQMVIVKATLPALIPVSKCSGFHEETQ